MQLAKIFRITGVPTESSWPGVTELSGFKAISGSLAALQQQLDQQGMLRAGLHQKFDALEALLNGSLIGEDGEQIGE